MTREEEIEKESNTRYSVSHPFIDIAKESFIEGACWADKTMIEKACEWLQENVNKYSYVIKVEDTNYRKVHFTESLIEDFKRYLEE